MPPVRYGTPSALTSGPVNGPTRSSICSVVDCSRSGCTVKGKKAAAIVKLWNIMFRPTWSERLPSPVGWARFADISSSRAVLIGLPASTTVEAGMRCTFPRTSR